MAQKMLHYAEADPAISVERRGTYEWISATDKLPNGLYEYSEGEVIVHDSTDSAKPVIKSWNLATDKLPSSNADKLKFLVAAKERLQFEVPPANDEFPSSIVLAPETKSYRYAIYVGKYDGKLGTVVAESETPIFVGEDGSSYSFEILCKLKR